MDLFGAKAKRQLAAIRAVVARSERGIHKRIDENRELLELLQEEAPELLRRCGWIEGWLASQDRFLADLEVATKVALYRLPENYPRPWPGRLRDLVNKEPV